jgi:Holliday junction resolvase RusA-like endonuclease
MEYGWHTIPGNVPSKSNCYRIGIVKGHTQLIKTNALKKYEESFYWHIGHYRGLGIKGLFEFYCKVFYPSKRSDLDNSLKVQLDCLQLTKTITNDNNCCKIVAEKFIDKDNPRVEFKIVTVTDSPTVSAP